MIRACCRTASASTVRQPGERHLDSRGGALHAIAVSDEVELLIAGGGLNGLLLGAACAGAGLSVAIADPREITASLDDEFDGRSSALGYGSRNVLEGIGIWPLIAADAEPILEIRVADNDSPLFLHYDHRDLAANAPLGYIVENRVLRRALVERLAAIPHCYFLGPLAVGSVTSGSAAVTASLSDGRSIKARLVAAADGQKSRLRRATGIRVVEWQYPQTGIVTTVLHDRPHRGIAVEHFLAAGPFAILPMTGDRSSIVWTEKAAAAPRLLALSDAEFAAELAARFGDFLGTVQPVGPRWAYPLTFLLAEHYVGPRLALIGEAAHAIHPIAGQGLNLGIRDVAALAELVIDARQLGLDIGAGSVLERYQQWRRFDVLAMAAVTDGLNRLFSNSIAPVRLARDLGLAVVNRIAPLKRALMRDAMGLTGELPRLVRGEPL
jgi:2-octaprenyl-6-methoxyphenol hydroxylase